MNKKMHFKYKIILTSSANGIRSLPFIKIYIYNSKYKSDKKYYENFYLCKTALNKNHYIIQSEYRYTYAEYLNKEYYFYHNIKYIISDNISIIDNKDYLKFEKILKFAIKKFMNYQENIIFQ